MNFLSEEITCDRLKKKRPNVPINNELKTSLTKNYRVMPLYERAITDHAFSRNHSLKNNEYLNCRWAEYLRLHMAKKPEPFQFPRISDYHFYNYDTCYKPELSVNLKPYNRYTLKNGPGVDKYGEIPIPSDIGFRKTGLMVDKMRLKPKKKITRIRRK